MEMLFDLWGLSMRKKFFAIVAVIVLVAVLKTAIVVPHQALLASDDKGCIYLLASAEKGLTYYAGAAWSGAGRFKTAEDWHKRVAEFAARIRK